MLLMFAFVLYCFNISTLFVWLLIIYTLFFSLSSAFFIFHKTFTIKVYFCFYLILLYNRFSYNKTKADINNICRKFKELFYNIEKAQNYSELNLEINLICHCCHIRTFSIRLDKTYICYYFLQISNIYWVCIFIF